MRKIVVASDSFKGSVSSIEVAECAELAIRKVFPDCEVVKIPVGDGGEGTVETLITAMGGEAVYCVVHDPLMRPVEATYGILGDNRTAVIEMATASGLTLVPVSERNPLRTTTYGTGMLQALGFRFLDRKGNELGLGGQILNQIYEIDCSRALSQLRETSFTIACDVNNPFYGEKGAAYVFARQKGADDAMVRLLDEGLRNFAEVIKRTGRIKIDDIPGAGAAGGLGGGFVAFLKAELKPGIRMVLDALRFDECIRGADLIITGEGKLDKQTCMGKTPCGVLQAGMRQGIPVIVMGGSVEEVEALNKSGFLAVLPLLPYPVSLEQAMDKDFTCWNIGRALEQQLRVIQYYMNH